MAFFHIDEFENEYPDKRFTYPVILLKDKNGLTEFVSNREINKIENVQDLIKVLTERSIDYFE